MSAPLVEWRNESTGQIHVTSNPKNLGKERLITNIAKIHSITKSQVTIIRFI